MAEALIKVGETHLWTADAKIVVNEQTGEVRDGLFALPTKDLQEYGKRGQATKIAQFFQLVLPGLILTKHVFQGLRRGLFNDQNADSDKEKWIYIRKPAFDVEWEGGRHGRIVERPPPGKAVFAVIISPNLKHKREFQSVDGWVGTWNWIQEDAVLSEAPVDWFERYDKKLWTRSDP